MNKKLIAITAAMMVLTGSMAFAANGSNQMPMNHNNGYTQHNGSYDQMSMNHNGRHGQHMYQLSDQAKQNSRSTWDSVCNFFGMHGEHGSHSGYAGHNGGHNGGHGGGHGGGHM